jgi:hypothetical protein
VRSVRRSRGVSMTGEPSEPGPATGPVGPKPVSLVGVFLMTAVIESAQVVTRPSLPPHLRLRLAATPLPHGVGASRVTVGAWSGGFRPRVPWLPDPVGYGGWHNRSGPDNLPDNHPCDLVSQQGVQATAASVRSCLAPAARRA